MSSQLNQYFAVLLHFWSKHLHLIMALQAGQKETFMLELPGYPDGISRGTDGSFWVALVNPNNPLLLNPIINTRCASVWRCSARRCPSMQHRFITD